MAATRDDITSWFETGKRNGYSHMVIICDTWDYTDAPEYLLTDPQGARIFVDDNDGKSMQKVMEVYKLTDPIEDQINKFRCFNY